MANSGVWDVDGTGMQEIEDKDVAERIRDKVSGFNVSVSAAGLAAAVAYVALPPLSG